MTRRNLSAEEVDEIGKNSAEICKKLLNMRYLPNAIEQTRELMRNLKLAHIEDALHPAAAIEGLGVMVKKLEESMPIQRTEYYALAQKLLDCGVTLIESASSNKERQLRLISIKLVVDRKLQNQ